MRAGGGRDLIEKMKNERKRERPSEKTKKFIRKRIQTRIRKMKKRRVKWSERRGRGEKREKEEDRGVV
jgi:hypothetical protein